MSSSGTKYNALEMSALPSGMRERFVLLIVIAIAMSYWAGFGTSLFISELTGKILQGYTVGVIGIATLTTLTVLFYVIHPWSVKRRFGMGKPVAAPLLGECEQLGTRSGLHRVTFLITDRLFQQDSIAFGYPWRRTICIGGGMKIVYRKSPEIFRAVVAHELSHLKHGDIDIGHLSRSIVQAMLVIAATLPLIVFWRYLRGYPYWHQLPFYDLEWTINSSKAFFGEIAIVSFYLCFANADYRAVLRNREYYADNGAQRLVGAAALRGVLRSSPGPRNYDILALFRYHPSRADRERTLQNPLSLLRGFVAEPALAGYYSGILTEFINLFGVFSGHLYSGSYWDYANRAVADTSSSAIAALPIVLIVLCLFVVASQGLRGGILFGLREVRFPEFFGRSVVSAAAFSTGLVVGLYVNPIYIEQTMLSAHPIVYELKWELVFGLLLGIGVTNILFGAYIRYRFPISVAAPLSRGARFFLLLTWAWCGLYIFQAILSLLATESDVGTAKSKLLAVSVGLMLLPLSTLGVGARVRRSRLHRLSRVRALNT